MDQQGENRQCPICEQVVTGSSIGDLLVPIFPSRKVHLHEGCVKKIVKVWIGEVVGPKLPKMAVILNKLL